MHQFARSQNAPIVRKVQQKFSWQRKSISNVQARAALGHVEYGARMNGFVEKNAPGDVGRTPLRFASFRTHRCCIPWGKTPARPPGAREFLATATSGRGWLIPSNDCELIKRPGASFWPILAMSDPPPTAAEKQTCCQVRKVPEAVNPLIRATLTVSEIVQPDS